MFYSTQVTFNPQRYIIKTTAIMQIIFLILIMKMMKKITEHQLNKLYHLDLMFIIFNIQIHQV